MNVDSLLKFTDRFYVSYSVFVCENYSFNSKQSVDLLNHRDKTVVKDIVTIYFLTYLQIVF